MVILRSGITVVGPLRRQAVNDHGLKAGAFRKEIEAHVDQGQFPEVRQTV